MLKCLSNIQKFEDKIEKALIVLGVLLVIFLWPKGTGYDGNFRFLSLDFLFRLGIVDDFKFSLVGPLFASPLYFLHTIFKNPHWWVSKFNSTFFLLSLMVFYQILKSYFDASTRRKFILLLLAGSIFSKNIKEFYGEPFTHLLAGLGIVLLVQKRRYSGFISLILANANIPGTLIANALIVVRMVLREKRFRYLLIPCVSLAVIFLENWIRRGSPFVSGYEGEAPVPGTYKILPYTGGPGFSYPLFFGFLSIFLSFGKGLVFFSPGLFLPLIFKLRWPNREFRFIYGQWLVYLFGLIFVYASWFNWYGGGFWGPRFFLFSALPASIVLAKFIKDPPRGWGSLFLLSLVLALSVWVSWCGLCIDESLSGGADGDLEALIWYVPEFSVIWRAFVLSPNLKINDYVFGFYFGAVFLSLWTSLFNSWVDKTKTYRCPDSLEVARSSL